MAKRSSQSFTKRQKELARKEKQQAKFEKRLERRRQKTENPGGMILEPGAGAEGEPFDSPAAGAEGEEPSNPDSEVPAGSAREEVA